MKPEVKVIQTGYSNSNGNGSFSADCTVSLIVSDKGMILVDTGGPSKKHQLLENLKRFGFTPEDICTVICTHGHSDHVGNLNLFSHAKFIVGYDVFTGDVYESFNFQDAAAKYVLSENIFVMPTPGHTHSDVSVVVQNTDVGTVVVAGDLFENERDLKNPSQWHCLSENINMQQLNRDKVLAIADYIVPGHGAMFKVHKEQL